MNAKRAFANSAVLRSSLLVPALLLFVLAGSRAQNPVSERSFDFPEAVVNRALTDLNAYSEMRLPGVDGFVLANGDASQYGRPYCRFRIETRIETPSRTRVKVEAKITAWYEAPHEGHPGYVLVSSNGRLENDLLDRLERRLRQGTADSVAGVVPLNEEIAQVRSRRQAAQQRESELQTQLGELEKALETRQPGSAVVMVQETGVPLMDAPSRSAHLLLRAGPEDEFELVGSHDAWDQVRVGAAATAWIRHADVVPAINNKTGGGTEPLSADNSTPFELTREQVQTFSGDWKELRGKPTLFLWMQPARGIVQPQPGDRWSYAKHIFAERAYLAAVSSQPYSGIAVIFDEPEGGVAAATLEGIERWLDGDTADLAFAKRCSMDPPEAFVSVSEPRQRALSNKKHLLISQQ